MQRGKKEFENISTVIIAAGYGPNRELLSQAYRNYEVFSSGHCKEVRKILEAIHERFNRGFRRLLFTPLSRWARKFD